MRNVIQLILGAMLFVACSSPKYTYNFDYYDYNSGKKVKAVAASVAQENVLQLNREELMASLSVLPAEEKKEEVAIEVAQADFKTKYKEMSKAEKKVFKKELKAQLKQYVKAQKSGDRVAMNEATKAMDHDLKMAIIFGAVGLTLNLFGGVNSIFWVLGVIAVVIGVVFLIKWLIRQ